MIIAGILIIVGLFIAFLSSTFQHHQSMDSFFGGLIALFVCAVLAWIVWIACSAS